MSLCPQIWFSDPFLCNPCRRPWIFKAITSVRSNNMNLKYQRFTPSGYNRVMALCIVVCSSVRFAPILKQNICCGGYQFYVFYLCIQLTSIFWRLCPGIQKYAIPCFHFTSNLGLYLIYLRSITYRILSLYSTTFFTVMKMIPLSHIETGPSFNWYSFLNWYLFLFLTLIWRI